MKEIRSDLRRVGRNGIDTALSARMVAALAATAALLGLILIAGLGAPGAPAKMRSTQLAKKYCQTTGGGRFVNIKQFPGEKIDRRLKQDIRFLIRKYNVFITDGYSLDPVHSSNGEHPIGLALDIVPNFSKGGDWDDIDRLAQWAEPSQNQTRAPFRWVGYNGDPGHGRGHHLHLSYSHSPTSYNTPAKTVYSVRCPVKREPTPDPSGEGGSGTGTGSGSGGGSGTGSGGTTSGGISASKGQKAAKGGSGGGISTRERSMSRVAPPQPESGGVGLR